MVFALISFAFHESTLEVGPGKPYTRIETAIAAAHPGDSIRIYPDPNGYKNTAVRIHTASLTIRGMGKAPVKINGDGFDYSGAGSIPRAIFQFDPEANGSSISNLDLSGAHNGSYNGAGIRIQSASNVTISDCIIHDNDMGVMSNGMQGDSKAASDQLIEYCLIERNGNLKDPGYNHNLYLGGTSVTLSHCEIRKSLTGHNVKSRAHYIQIEGCYIHDSANREIDLPEAWDTTRPYSNAVLVGNRIIKDPACSGNRGVIHFGAEKGTRVGRLYLFSNTIVTPFVSPVISVTAPGTLVTAELNLILNTVQSKAALWESSSKDVSLSATYNGLSPAYGHVAGNSIAESRSDTFGLIPPTYLKKDRASTGKVPRLEWIDGDAVKKSMSGPRDDLSRNAGPRSAN